MPFREETSKLAPHNRLVDIAFSPNNKHLVVTLAPDQLVGWNSTGKEMFRTTLPFEVPRMSPGSLPPLQWDPGRTAWLVGGQFLVDYKKQLLWELRRSSVLGAAAHMLDKDRGLVVTESPKRKLILFQFPAEIAAATTAIKEEQKPYLRPGDTIKLAVTTTDAAPRDSQIIQRLEKFLSEALLRRGLKTGDVGELSLDIAHTSTEKDRCELQLQLTAPGAKSPLWEGSCTIKLDAILVDPFALITMTEFPTFISRRSPSLQLPIVAKVD